MEAFFKNPGAQPKVAKPAIEKPWVEKYRPKSVDEVAFQDEVVAVLKSSLAGHDMPHLLLYGPPGTGKTSTILAIARQLFGPELLKSRVLELNASDERGIDVIREKVKTFAQLTANTATAKGYPCPAYKIIILDEADSMTEAAQSALRRTMEQYSKVTRFCLVCNYVSRIIEPLASRCAKFRFKPLSGETQKIRINEIKEKENVVCNDEVVDRLVILSGGDLRQAITVLQSAHRLKAGREIVKADIEDIAGVLADETIEHLFQSCKSNSFEQVQVAVNNIIASGYSAVQVLSQLHDCLVTKETEEILDLKKARIMEKIAEADKCLIDAADEELQLLNVCAYIMKEISM